MFYYLTFISLPLLLFKIYIQTFIIGDKQRLAFSTNSLDSLFFIILSVIIYLTDMLT